MMKWSKSTWLYRDDDWSSPPRRRSHVRKVRPSASPLRKRAKGKSKGKGKDPRGWWTWVPSKTADAPWRAKDKEDSKETIEIVDEDKEDEDDEYWGPWNESSWGKRYDKDCEQSASASTNNKKTSAVPRRRRTATSSTGGTRTAPDTGGAAMAQWRGLLGIPDYGECRAVPERQLEAIRAYAMDMTMAEFTELMSNWARFIALLLAEVNHSLMRTRKMQEANKEKWTLPSKKDHEGEDKGGRPDGDASSLMQMNKAAPVFTLMRRLRASFDLLPPRRQRTRAAILLRRLYDSGHFRHGKRVLEPYLTSLETLLQAYGRAEETAVEDVDEAWCDAVWDDVLEALNTVMRGGGDSEGRAKIVKRQKVGESQPLQLPRGPHLSEGLQPTLQMSVASMTGSVVGTCTVPMREEGQPYQVRLEHRAEGMPSCSTDIQILPGSAEQMYQLWSKELSLM